MGSLFSLGHCVIRNETINVCHRGAAPACVWEQGTGVARGTWLCAQSPISLALEGSVPSMGHPSWLVLLLWAFGVDAKGRSPLGLGWVMWWESLQSQASSSEM